MIPVQFLEAGGSEGLSNAPTVTQHKGESWDLNPGNTLLRMYVPKALCYIASQMVRRRETFKATCGAVPCLLWR